MIGDKRDLQSLPKNWIWVDLESSCQKLTDGAHFSPKYVKEGYPFITISDVKGERIDFPSAKFVSKSDFEKLKENCNPRKGDVLFSKDGTVGKVIEINFEKEFIVLSSLAILRPYPKLVTPSYLKFLLQSQMVLNQCIRLKTGTALTRIILRNLRTVKIPIPPLNEQQRIAVKVEELFSFLDAGVESLRKVQAQLKRYRQAVLKYAFEGKLTEEWRKTHKDQIEPAQVLFHKIKEERIRRGIGQWKKAETIAIKDLPEIPDDWIWVHAQEVCENITNGYTPSASELHNSNGEIPFIKINNLTFTGQLDLSKNKTFIDKKIHETSLKRSKVFPGDVLINIVGPPLGKVSVVPNLYPEWNINQAIVFFRPIEGYNRDFLALCLQTNSIISHLTNQAQATAGQFNISVNMSRNLLIPLPPKEEQEKIVFEIRKHLNAIEQVAATINESMSQSNHLRNSVLKAAFIGQLVPQDPDDEPAVKLLERIKAELIKSEVVVSSRLNDKKSKIDKQLELSRYVK